MNQEKNTLKTVGSPIKYLIVGILLAFIADFSESTFVANHPELFGSLIQSQRLKATDYTTYPFTFENDIIRPFEEGTVNKLKNILDYFFKYLPNDICYMLGRESKIEKVAKDMGIHSYEEYDISKIQPEFLKYSEINSRTFIYHFIRFFSESLMLGFFFGTASFFLTKTGVPSFLGWTILGSFIIFFLVHFIISHYDPFKFRLVEDKKAIEDSIKMAVSIDSVRTANKISQSIQNATYSHLNNGESPFDNCFGQAQYDGQVTLKFENISNSDIVVLLYDVYSGKTILNKYIRSDSSFPLNRLRQGRYKVQVLLGNNWKTNIENLCGNKGFFEMTNGYAESIDTLFFKDKGNYKYQLPVDIGTSISGNILTGEEEDTVRELPSSTFSYGESPKIHIERGRKLKFIEYKKINKFEFFKR